MMLKKLNEYRDLIFEKKAIAHIAIIRSNGTPHVTPVWFDCKEEEFEDLVFYFNSAKGRVKTNSLKLGSVVSISILDPDSPYRYLGINGEIIQIIEGQEAIQHINELSVKYLGRNWEIPEGQIRVKYKVKIKDIFN